MYYRHFGKALSPEVFDNLLRDLRKEAFGRGGKNLDIYDYYKYRVAFATERDLGLMFIFITGLTDSQEAIKKELLRCKKDFLNLFEDILQVEHDASTFEMFDPTIDAIHRNMRPKISLVGFSGVGKTTITKLIKAEEIPMKHIPTITGDIATIKIGKLHFHLWDFAGQEQFSYLWNNFIKGSDAVLLITDSTLENVEKSKFFLELIKEQAPNAHAAVIGNKQDLEEALKPDQIEKIIGLKAYKMIATEAGNRDKMIQIIADILDMSAEVSPLLKPLMDRDKLTKEAEKALEENRLLDASEIYEKISDLCLELGDDSYSQEFYELSQKIRKTVETASKKGKGEELAKEEGKIPSKELEKTDITEKTILPKLNAPKPKAKPLPSLTLKKPEAIKIEPPANEAEKARSTGSGDTRIEKKQEEEIQIPIKVNPEEFKIKERPKEVVHVPKDAKTKLKTSAFGHVKNVESTPEIKPQKPVEKPKPMETIISEGKEEIKSPVSETRDEKKEEKSKEETTEGVQRKDLEKTLLDLKIKKANISKMSLEIEMQELTGEISAKDVKEKLEKIELLEEKITSQIVEIENILKTLD